MARANRRQNLTGIVDEEFTASVLPYGEWAALANDDIDLVRKAPPDVGLGDPRQLLDPRSRCVTVEADQRSRLVQLHGGKDVVVARHPVSLDSHVAQTKPDIGGEPIDLSEQGFDMAHRLAATGRHEKCNSRDGGRRNRQPTAR